MQPPMSPITTWRSATCWATPPTTAAFKHPFTCAVPTAVSYVSADIAVTICHVFIGNSKKMIELGCRPDH
jgi:hypothetical protein